MLDENYYVYKKEVDWSLLHEGVGIPVTIQVVFQHSINQFLSRGQSKNIYLVIEGKTYKAELKNQKFDERKYPNRTDIMQIRYNPQSDIAQKLRNIFSSSYQYILEQRNAIFDKQKKFINVPKEQKEYLAIYTTVYADTYLLDCITREDTIATKEQIAHEDEQEYETSINYGLMDSKATIETACQTTKIRKLSRAIGDNLKLLYDYRCQLCGQNISERYEVAVAESHHIDPFVESLNNNADNQIIICPNHHRIIHRANPVFYRGKLTFAYKNGVEERIVLDRHLSRHRTAGSMG
ncbi:MAG TPA: HNH endonuclease [Clostridiales bacterium]|nr:HNH endonuclease [Clostridiales bacterium]